MTKVGKFIQQQLTAGFSTVPPDNTDIYNFQFSDRMSGTVMQPSPGVLGYRLTYQWTGSSVGYKLDVDWHPATKWLAEQVEPWQITHRSRTAVIAASPLRVPEQMKKISDVLEWKPTFERFSLSDAKSLELYLMVMDKTLKHFSFDERWIQKYIAKHIGSSLGRTGETRYSWKHTLSMPLSEWRTIYESTVENLESLKRHAGEYLNVVFNHGLRARSPSMDNFSDYYEGEIERTRIVMFHQYLSLWNVFLPNKKDWYQDIISETEKMFQVQPVVHYPMIEGGDIYLTTSDLLNDGFEMTAYDGKTWEASVGMILGSAFNPLMVNLGGLNMLPSGIAMTSLLGTIASVIVNKNSNGEMIVLGDDQNHFTKGGLHGHPRVPWIEEQPMDSKTKTILGSSFWDPNAPRLTGFKVMSDRADKALPLILSGEQRFIESHPKRDPRERAAWIGMFLGFYGDGTLISRLRKEKITDLDFFAPNELIQDLVDDHGGDPFGWAEREGVKKLITTGV
jgi:hypothetical protein